MAGHKEMGPPSARWETRQSRLAPARCCWPGVGPTESPHRVASSCFVVPNYCPAQRMSREMSFDAHGNGGNVIWNIDSRKCCLPGSACPDHLEDFDWLWRSMTNIDPARSPTQRRTLSSITQQLACICSGSSPIYRETAPVGLREEPLRARSVCKGLWSDRKLALQQARVPGFIYRGMD